MTVSSTTTKVSYTGGTSTSLPYTFKIFADGDLEVYKNGSLLTLTTDYTVTGAGDDSGGTVELVAARVASDVVLIRAGAGSYPGT